MKPVSDKTATFAILYGMEVFVSEFMTEKRQHSRSPSRAARRIKLGHRQCFKDFPSPNIYRAGSRLMMHPARMAELRKELALRADDIERRALLAPMERPAVTGSITGRWSGGALTSEKLLESFRRLYPNSTRLWP